MSQKEANHSLDNMQRFLEKLRKKPVETRKRYALGTSVTVSGLIFVMWLTVVSFGPFGSEGSLQNTNIGETQTASPLSAFSNNASSAFQELRDQLSSMDAALGTSSDQSGDTNQVSDNNQSNTRYDDSPEAYWEDEYYGEVNGTSSNSQPASTEQETSGDEESFTSRNYNPNQESDWFNQ